MKLICSRCGKTAIKDGYLTKCLDCGHSEVKQTGKYDGFIFPTIVLLITILLVPFIAVAIGCTLGMSAIMHYIDHMWGNRNE